MPDDGDDRKQLLRRLTAAFLAWIRREMDPAGKAALHDLDARANLMIDALPDSDPVSIAGLDAGSAEAGIDWVLTALRQAYPGDWTTLACESLRMVLRLHLDDVVAIALPPDILQPTPPKEQ